MPESSSSQDVIEREREFHNQRFASETRQPQQKFYRTLTNCFDYYHLRIREYAAKADVLEYGCAKGEETLKLAPLARSVVGIDISDVAVAAGQQQAAASAIANVKFFAMNAEAMDFADGSFDLVFGSGIIHHLDSARAFAEISRVLRPGGHAVFAEPLGHNPLINWYRRRTPDARTADEHPLRRADFKIAKRYFGDLHVAFFGLLSIAVSPLLKTPMGRPALRIAILLDRLLLRVPLLRWQAWYAVLVCTKG